MRLLSLGFAGYRSFAARGPASPNRELQRLTLGPLTILLGKNNSGKSSAARMPHHVLTAMGAQGEDPLPLEGPKGKYGRTFRDIQHGGNFFNPLDLDVTFVAANSKEFHLVSRVAKIGALSGDIVPELESSTLNGEAQPPEIGVRGLMPQLTEAETLRQEARDLLRSSCYLPPVREAISQTYSADAEAVPSPPENNGTSARVLFADPELRSSVSAWTEQNLEGWRVEIEQNLDLFQLMGHRNGQKINLAASGQGIQQVLPVVTLCRWRKLREAGSAYLDVIEQPELHLHDAAHAALGDLLLDAVQDRRGNLIVETHSESLVLRVRRRVAEGLAPESVAIYFVEDTGDGSQLRPVNLDGNGDVDWWPDGVFSEAFEEVKALRRAQRSRGDQ